MCCVRRKTKCKLFFNLHIFNTKNPNPKRFFMNMVYVCTYRGSQILGVCGGIVMYSRQKRCCSGCMIKPGMKQFSLVLPQKHTHTSWDLCIKALNIKSEKPLRKQLESHWSAFFFLVSTSHIVLYQSPVFGLFCHCYK